MKLPPKPPRRANEARDLTRPIEAALNRIPGVRVARNNTGVLRDARGIPVRFGLGTGSADLVGIVTGRPFCLEVKGPRGRSTDDQVRWGKAVRALGGFYAVVHSIDEARDAVTRCRAGASE